MGLAVPHSTTPSPAMLLQRIPSLLLLISCGLVICCLSGCLSVARDAAQPNDVEQVILERLTRDQFVIIDSYDRDEFDHLIVNTLQGSEKVRYIIKPVQPGSPRLNIHRINDRSQLEISESDQVGTFQQPTRFR